MQSCIAVCSIFCKAFSYLCIIFVNHTTKMTVESLITYIFKICANKTVCFQHHLCKPQTLIFFIICICCTHRSGLHEIPTMICIFPHGFENRHACKWISDNFPEIVTYILFLENCLKSICMHDCSPTHMKKSFFFFKVWDRFAL